jgi:hypothetical protein
MVLSGSKKTTYRASITNQNSGGGSKKAGIPPTAAVSHATRDAYHENGNGLLSTKWMNRLILTKPPSQTRPIGINVVIKMQ